MTQPCRLWTCLVFSLLFFARAASAAPRDLSAYTLRVQVFTRSWTGSERAGYSGYGRGNLIEGAETHGIDYTYQCDVNFLTSNPTEAYPAKWKKKTQTIEMLIGVIGSPDKTRSCELKVSLKDFVFDRTLRTMTQEEYRTQEAKREAMLSEMKPEDTNPANYPLKLALLNLIWTERVGGMHIGTGQGNLFAGAGPRSVDLTANCPVTIPPNPEGRYYRAQWKHEGTEVLVLIYKNVDQTPAVCDLKINMHSDVYILTSPGVVRAVSQEEYLKLHQSASRNATAAP